MSRFLRRLFWFVTLPAAFLAVVFVGGFLQELAPDGVPQACREAGIDLPLDDPWIDVDLQKMTLSLMDGKTMVARYDAGYGSGPIGRVAQRESGTPLGEYHIVEKAKRKSVFKHGSRWIRIDYPSPDDAELAYERGFISEEERRRIVEAHAQGEPPPSDTPMKGPLGIQGNLFFFRERRFTDGSIALSNADINELYEHVTPGMRVLIHARQ